MTARGRIVWLWIGALVCATRLAFSAEILGARLQTLPPQPYVGQPFELQISIETTPGCELQGMSIEGLPGEDLVQFGQPEGRPREQVRRDGRSVDIHRYVSAARGQAALRRELRTSLSVTLVERRTVGFFSSWASTARAVRLAPYVLEIRSLPEEGQPEGFAGAIGQFSLHAALEPAEVAVNDLVTLTVEVRGTGHLAQAQALLPTPDPGIRAYPAQELRRDTQGNLALRQVLIPLATNVTGVGAVRFPYFDPQVGAYRVAVAGPLRLRVGPAGTGSGTPSVRTLAAPRSQPPTFDAGLERMSGRLGPELRRVGPFAVALLISALVAGWLRARHAALAVTAAVVVFVGVAWGGRRIVRVEALPVVQLTDASELRLAPAGTARLTGRIGSGARVELLETWEGWVRVSAGTRRGWLPAERVAGAKPREQAP